MEFLGSGGVQRELLGIFVLKSKLVDFLELCIIEASVITILKASLLFDVVTISKCS